MKKQLKKLSLKKVIVSELSNGDQSEVMGGISSARNCTGILCCDGTMYTCAYDEMCQCTYRDPYSCPVTGY